MNIITPDTKWDDVELSIRARSAVKRLGFVYIKDAAIKNDRDVLRLKNVSRKTFNEIEGFLLKAGLKFINK